MNIVKVDQRSPEWLEMRKGVLTSCRIAAACSFNKSGKESEKRAKLKIELLQELITGRAVEHYVSPAMEHGMEFEIAARGEYQFRKEVEVEAVGFVWHPTLERCGASPDGMVGSNRFVEFKAPNTNTHLQYLADGVVPSDYIPQMQWQMACAGPEIEVNDFVSFDPRLPEELQMFIVPLERDNKKIAYYEEQAVIFLEEVVQLAEKIKRNAKHQTIEEKLRESVKQSRGKYTDEQLKAMLADEGIAVP